MTTAGFILLTAGLIGLCISIFLALLYVESKPTGAKKVLYTNDLNIALEVKVNNAWVNMRDVHALDALQNDTRYRVRKDDNIVYIDDVSQTEFIETTGLGDTFWLKHVESEYRDLVYIRINKATLVEIEKIESLRIGRFEKVIRQEITNKMVVEYTVISVDEYLRHIRLRKDNTVLLQQFIKPTKGE